MADKRKSLEKIKLEARMYERQLLIATLLVGLIIIGVWGLSWIVTRCMC